MPSIKVKRELPGQSAKDCYLACLQALKEAGYMIIKQRDYGWFVIASKVIDSEELTCNILASPGVSASVDLNMSAVNIDEIRLQDHANNLLHLITKKLE